MVPAYPSGLNCVAALVQPIPAACGDAKQTISGYIDFLLQRRQYRCILMKLAPSID
jgi:hypothetical protein